MVHCYLRDASSLVQCSPSTSYLVPPSRPIRRRGAAVETRAAKEVRGSVARRLPAATLRLPAPSATSTLSVPALQCTHTHHSNQQPDSLRLLQAGPPKPNPRFSRKDLKRIKQQGPTMADLQVWCVGLHGCPQLPMPCATLLAPSSLLQGATGFRRTPACGSTCTKPASRAQLCWLGWQPPTQLPAAAAASPPLPPPAGAL